MAKKQTAVEDVKITLSASKSEELFHTAMCNGLGELRYYDLDFTYAKKDYAKAQESLKKKITSGKIPKEMCGYKKPSEVKVDDICFEDVLMEILRNGDKLKVVDEGCDGEYTKSITLKNVHERVSHTPFRHLNDALNEGGDAITADVILQTVFFDDVIFG